MLAGFSKRGLTGFLPRPPLHDWSARRQILLETGWDYLRRLGSRHPSDIKYDDAITAIWAASEVLPPPRNEFIDFKCSSFGRTEVMCASSIDPTSSTSLFHPPFFYPECYGSKVIKAWGCGGTRTAPSLLYDHRHEIILHHRSLHRTLLRQRYDFPSHFGQHLWPERQFTFECCMLYWKPRPVRFVRDLRSSAGFPKSCWIRWCRLGLQWLRFAPFY